ncbi:MAG: hypothetical protein IH589_10630 [Anaerolineales bacterium]|nr:hypothetical protein [Anaerolineales bacterium]
MKIKTYFPAIVTSLLSLLVLIGIPAWFLINAFTSKYPEDVSTKISLSLKQALPLVALIIVFLWLGAGVDFGLTRIKDKARRKAASLIVYLASFFVCLVLPLLSLVFVYGIFSAGEGWKKLPAPPETPVAVAAGGGSSLTIETENGNYYYCWVKNLAGCWQPDDKPSSPVIGSENNTTEVTGNMPQIAPPDGVVSMLGISHRNGPELFEFHYAVLEDGTVWYLEREVNSYGAWFITGLLAMLVVPILFCSLVFFAGVGVSSLARWLAGRIWREFETA